MSVLIGLCDEGLEILVFIEGNSEPERTVLPFEALLALMQWYQVMHA